MDNKPINMHPNDKKSSEQLTKRDLQARETKERIYNCADILFKERGYDNTTVEDIAALSGTSIGSFYHHFKSKEEIMRIWMTEFDAQYRAYYEDVLCRPPIVNYHILEKICLFLGKSTEIFSSHGVMLSRTTYTLILRDYDFGSYVISPSRDYYSIMSILVEDALQSGALNQQFSKDQIIQHITSICRGCMIEWLLTNGATDLVSSTKTLIRAYLQSIANNKL